jgi:hypothetical protein
MVNDCDNETALNDGLAPWADAGAEAVILHVPMPVVMPLTVQGPEAV